MSDLAIRKLGWQFDDVEFYFIPQSREFSAFMNGISFMAVGMERYFSKAMKDAEKLITDPTVLKECKMFSRQEMVHSKAHFKHCKALIAKCPRFTGRARRFDPHVRRPLRAREPQISFAVHGRAGVCLHTAMPDHEDVWPEDTLLAI